LDILKSNHDAGVFMRYRPAGNVLGERARRS